jgi:hypothetical protein
MTMRTPRSGTESYLPGSDARKAGLSQETALPAEKLPV